MRNPRVSVICANCGAEFMAKPSTNARFCSRKCWANRGHLPIALFTCERCGKEFEQQALNASRFCSWECRYPGGGPVELTCRCGKRFTRKASQVRRSEEQFCSKECAAAAKERPLTGKKTCGKCGHEKEYGEFYADRTGRAVGGVGSACKECHSKRGLDPVVRERERQAQALWRERNRESYNAYQRKKVLDRWHRQRSLPSTLTDEEWSYCLEWFGHACVYCGQVPKETMHRDHFVPVAMGGGYVADNMVPACKRCNSRKKDRDPFDGVTVPSEVLARILTYFDSLAN